MMQEKQEEKIDSVNSTTGGNLGEGYPPAEAEAEAEAEAVRLSSGAVCSPAGMVYRVADSAAMERLGRDLAAVLRAGDLVVLSGPLGAGKTTLTRGIGAGLGVREPITSPTFVLARTHPNLSDGPALVHVDAYRLSDAMALDDLDLDLETSVVVVEWGAGLVSGMTQSWLDVVIERPTGAGSGPGIGTASVARAGTGAEPDVPASAPSLSTPVVNPGPDGADGHEDAEGIRGPQPTPAAEDAAFAAEEPRLVTLRGYGQRWNPGEAPQQP